MATKVKWDAKDPQDEADFWLFCTDFLLEFDETITDVDVTVPDEIELLDSDFIADKIRARLGGGTDSMAYDIIFLFTTSSGQKFREIVELPVKNRIIKK